MRRVRLRLRYSPPFPQVCSVLACRLSYSRRANQSAFRSNGPRHVVHGPHDNYGCCHAHTYFHSRCASFHRRLLSERACSKEEEEGERELFSRFFFFWMLLISIPPVLSKLIVLCFICYKIRSTILFDDNFDKFLHDVECKEKRNIPEEKNKTLEFITVLPSSHSNNR